ncbi:MULTISPECIES: pirin family protein [Gordonia]|uniref:Pirin family protein n=1 Tax=Gordonia cholesterolivorans TaxID=559625 RepID=A0ABN3HEI3_9ACTN
MTVTVIPAADRHFWSNEWLSSRQSFPGTGNFDIFANAHGVLAMHNDDVVDPGEGLDAHHHQNMEIVTWVVEGSLIHRDSHGHTVTLEAGQAGAMTAGRGITHSERNAASRASGRRLRVIQMWVPPHAAELEPDHGYRDFGSRLAAGDPVVVASGRPQHAGSDALTIANRYAALHVARPRPGRAITLPAAPFAHLFVVRGEVSTSSRELPRAPIAEGDAVRFTDGGEVTLEASTDAEILYWEMHASFDAARPA